MTRRIKRQRDFEIALTIKSDSFLRPPRDSQRNWLLKGAMNEFASNLIALDGEARWFVPGVEGVPSEDRTQAALSDEEIMEDWQRPMMQAMADYATAAHGRVLEVGFGRGVSADMIQEGGVESHTIIECNDSIVQRFESWRTQYPDRDIAIVHGLWQDTLPGLGEFDAIFFHTYPLNEAEFVDQIASSTTFAEHFFPHAAEHLVEGGVFTYLSNEIDSLSRPHQRALLQHFRSIEIRVVDGLPVPDDVHDAWWSKKMVAVKAVK